MSDFREDAYISDDEIRRAFLFSMRLNNLASRALSGEMFSTLTSVNVSNAGALDELESIAIPLTDFDRRIDSSRRAERNFRKLLVPAAVLMVSNHFEINWAALEDPGDAATLASLETPDRSIYVNRHMASIDADETLLRGISEGAIYDGRPALVNYNLLVSNISQPQD